MEKKRTYTLDEIEQETGFDKRTIAYYVQQELLPRVGRRGPRTRYPQAYLDRLLLIRRIRDRQDRGELGSVTLGDIKQFFDDTPRAKIADMVAGREPLDIEPHAAESFPAEGAMATPRGRAEALMRMSGPRSDDRKLLAFPSEPPSVDAMDFLASPPADEDDSTLLLDLDSGPPVFKLGEVGESDPGYTVAQEPRPADMETISRLLRSLAEAAGTATRGRRGSSENWTRARIMPGMSISVRNLDRGDSPLLDRLALELRRMIRHGDKK